LKLPNFQSTARSSTRSKHRAQTRKAHKQEQIRQYTNQEKALKKEQGLAQGPRTQKHSGLSGDLDHITQGYVLGIFKFNKDVHRLFQRHTLFIIKKVIFI
jgi:cell shape-determining protein MreC